MEEKMRNYNKPIIELLTISSMDITVLMTLRQNIPKALRTILRSCKRQQATHGSNGLTNYPRTE